MSTAFARRVVRAAKPSWTFAPLSGEGAARHGGRFNPKGMSALYTSFDFETCAREVRFSLNGDPYTFYHLDVTSSRIIDLSSRHTREAYRIDWNDLVCPDWEARMNMGQVPRSHEVALALYEEGADGVVIPSFALGATPDDLNLLLWRWQSEGREDVSEGAAVSVVRPEMLPRDRSSWG